ncbi:MAG TPA: PRC-barrel domain-containing protein [Gemmatimonadaceae bacterium]|nr:PRC-barrel domain-containing protein [Gemmatimonadaceae bacterium]
MTKKDPRRDAAGIGPYARERERLVPLSDLHGWNVTGDDVDIRSWEVKTLSGRVLGAVRDLLVDPDAGEVVMLDVDLTGTDRHAYVPIRVVEIDRTHRVVRADSGDFEEHDAVHGDGAKREIPVRRDVRYADTRDVPEERIIDQRPIVEETVVRRRDVDPDARP